MTYNCQQKQVNRLVRAFILPAFLFSIALLPRLIALNTFLTPDEYRWLGRSRDFLVGLLRKDWAATLQVGHPGVTTMWTGSMGILYRYWTRPASAPDDLLTFVRQVSNEPADVTFIASVRFPTVLITSLFVVIFYALVSRLFDDRRVGVVAALLLALDPFHIGLSRILHQDALATTFMTLSLLPMLGYWLQGWTRRWLILSAIASGLAFLSKSPAMFLMPFCALSGFVWAVQRWRRGQWQGWSDLRRLLTDGLLWGGVAWLTVLVLWPAMWVSPVKVLGAVFGTSFQYATEIDDKANFFLGQITSDPGPLFYPLVWLLRTTPITMLGVFALGGLALHNAASRQPERYSSTKTLTGMLLLYAALFSVLITLAEKKQDRYLLPIFPVLDTLAAQGLVYISNVSCQMRSIKSRIRNLQSLILAVVLLFQGILVVINYPYYFTYYNPLLGGAPLAARLMTVGWGEGLDQAANYLNDLPNADRLRVSAWYQDSFATFFRGQTTGFSSKAGETLSSDYAVMYRNQIQRELPTSELVHYLLEHHTPVFTVTMQGVDYVYVYQLPLARRSDWQESRLPGQATFFGIGEIDLSRESTDTGTEAGPFSLRLYWQNDDLAADQGWWVALQAVDGLLQAWQECQLLPDFAGERLTVGALLESECRLAGERLAPGVYHLRVGVGPKVNGITTIPFPEGELAIVVGEDGRPQVVSRLAALDTLARPSLPGDLRPADLVYQEAVRLVGYTTELTSQAGHQGYQLRLFWQALQPLALRELNKGLAVRIAFLSPQQEVLATVEGRFNNDDILPATWPTGKVLVGTYWLPVPEPGPGWSQFRLNVALNGKPLFPLDHNGDPAEPVLPVPAP